MTAPKSIADGRKRPVVAAIPGLCQMPDSNVLFTMQQAMVWAIRIAMP
jgi:hypothetical protein